MFIPQVESVILRALQMNLKEFYKKDKLNCLHDGGM